MAVWCKDSSEVTIYTNYDFIDEDDPIKETELKAGEYIRQMTMNELLILFEKQNEIL